MRALLLILIIPCMAAWAGCNSGGVGGGDGVPVASDDSVNTVDNNDAGGTGSVVTWGRAFDGDYTGALTSIWGSGSDDVFAGGGQIDQAEVYHYDGLVWRAMEVPAVPLLAAVFGFGPNDVYAVGEGGGAIHYTGTTWTELDTGTDEVLWSIWGNSPTDTWMVGGDPSMPNPPVILNYDGETFTRVDAPANNRNASALFNVCGVGNRVFAVGSLGLVIELDAGTRQWNQIPTGGAANQDFLGMWRTSEMNFVAVGGRAPNGGRIGVFNGQTWTTTEFSSSLGLNAVYMVQPDEVLVGGANGYVGLYNPMTNTLTDEVSGTSDTIRGVWSDGAGRYYCVGGYFATPFHGVSLLRTLENATSVNFIRAGSQPDNNGDKLPDAPLTVDGVAPDQDVELSDDDDTAPSSDETLTVAFGSLDEDRDYVSIADGGDLLVRKNDQSGELFVDLVLRVTVFPAEAAGDSVTVSHKLAMASEGRVISEYSGLGTLLDVEAMPGVLEIRRGAVFDPAVMPAEVDGENVTFSVTVEYNNTDPPLAVTASQMFRLVDAT